jgi:cephalosporin-C deacetylase-like acetyl esterase
MREECMNRRKFVLSSGALLLSPAFARIRAFAETPPASESGRSYGEEMPDMLISYLTTNLNKLASTWDRSRAQVRTAADVETRNSFVREKLLLMLRGFPPKTPLRAVTVRTTQKDGYQVENVMFCSRPDFWVTGNLYLPTSGAGPFPGIISPCGHYPLARMLPQYQSAYISLVKSGFVVLSYDPIGQGERRQYWNPDTDVTDVGGPIFEHSMAGQLLLMLGENLTEYFVWDGMRAIDYLLARPEVDSERIGCAGHSGGGTVTKFITAADERVKCAAILEGGTANMWPSHSVGPADVEQNLFPAALYGIDNVDLHVAIAPRPLLVGIEHYGENFDKAADAIRDRYRQLGRVEKFATVAADDPHAWTPKLRLATTDWFCRWFYGRKGPLEEAAYEPSRPDDLRCTPEGSLRFARKGATIFSLISEKLVDLPPSQSPPRTDVELAACQDEIREKVRRLLRFQHQERPLGVRPIVSTPREGYRVEKIEFLSEPGIYIPAWVFLPEVRRNMLSTILYLNDEGMESDGMEFEGAEGSGLKYGVLDQLARRGYLVVAVDVRGIGETRPSHLTSLSSGEFGQLFDTETSMAYAAWAMDRSLLGMRVQDVMRSVDYVLQREKAEGQRVHLIGKGMAGLWCLFAAALDSRISSLISVESLVSYRTLAQADRYLYGANVLVPDILLHLDLAQIAAAVAPRPLAIIAPKDAMKNTVDSAQAQAAYQWAQAAYKATASGEDFRIECQGQGLDTAEHYLSLIRAADGQ